MPAASRYHTFSDPDPEDADDERSFSDVDDSFNAALNRRRHAHARTASVMRQFLGQDIRPTSRKELMGWYSYAWAAEVFVVCGVGSFIPVTLEQLARENGVLLSDKSVSCMAGSNSSGSIGGGIGDEGNGQCVVYLFGWWMNTASFAMYTFSISVLLQSLIIVSMSGAADHGAYRKRLLLTFGFLGSIATMLFIFVSSRIYIFGAFLAILGNIGFGASFVLLNAFLPVLVRHHPRLIYGAGASSLPPSTADSTENPSLLDSISDEDFLMGDYSGKESPGLRLSTKISSYGIAVGYTAAVLLQTFAIMLVLLTQSTTWSLRLVLFLIGLWWFLFTIPSALWLRPRPGPPLPPLHRDVSNSAAATEATVRAEDNSRQGYIKIIHVKKLKDVLVWIPSALRLRPNPDPPLPPLHREVFNGATASGTMARVEDNSWWEYIKYAWIGLGKTILRAKRLRDVMLFLTAWFLVSDGIATVSGTAVLFAKTNLHMKPPALALISVISTVCGVCGAFAWPRIAAIFKRTPSQTILICIAVFELIPIYGLLGFIPAVQKSGIGGLTSPWEMYILGAVYGFVLGGVSGYCRSVFGELIPPGSEAAFYALYAVTDKGSSIFGPTIVGALTDRYGDIRVAFWFLAVLLALPLPLIASVDLGRGRREGRILAREELEEVEG